MDGKIVNYRKSVHNQKTNHLVVTIEGIDSKDKATKLVGKKVIYNTGKKDMIGKINAIHGNKGALRAVFDTGLPGQALGQNVKYKRILTGSPVTKSPLDLFSQCYFLDPWLLDHQSFYSFKTRYADRKSTRLNSSHVSESRMPSSA